MSSIKIEHQVPGQAAPIRTNMGLQDRIAVVGRPGSGRSSLLRSVEQSLEDSGQAVVVNPEEVQGRDTLQKRYRRIAPDDFAAAMVATGLWEQRTTSFGQLSAEQKIRAALVPAFLPGKRTIIIDEWLDPLDPWRLHGLLDQWLADRSVGLIIATNRIELMERMERLWVIDRIGLRFDGSPSELRQHIRPSMLKIQSREPGPVQALVEPFCIDMAVDGTELTVSARQGQALAANLLVKGYGMVETVAVKIPSFQEALLELLRP